MCVKFVDLKPKIVVRWPENYMYIHIIPRFWYFNTKARWVGFVIFCPIVSYGFSCSELYQAKWSSFCRSSFETSWKKNTNWCQVWSYLSKIQTLFKHECTTMNLGGDLIADSSTLNNMKAKFIINLSFSSYEHVSAARNATSQ